MVGMQRTNFYRLMKRHSIKLPEKAATEQTAELSELDAE
jgi:hypothetical protein